MSPELLARLIDSHAAALVLYARQWTREPEDVVQEAFVKLSLERHAPRDPAAWLYRVARNGALDAAKKVRRRRHRETAIAREQPWFSAPAEADCDAAAAQAALEQLPGDEREILVSRLWGGLNFEQIGAVMGCSASTAFRRYTAAIEILKRLLNPPCPTASSKDSRG